MMERTEMTTLRKSVEKKKVGYIRSQDIMRQNNAQGKGYRIKGRRNGRYEQVSRMAPDRIVRTVRDISPTDKCSCGRPRKRWSDTFWKQQSSSQT
jgi:hypothetical protein